MKKLFLAFIGLIISFFSVWAGDVPTNGLLYNTKESNALTFSCQQEKYGLLVCDFTQTMVSKKAKPKELAKKLQGAREEFNRGGMKMSVKECKTYSFFVDILKGRKEPPKKGFLSKKSDVEKADMLQLGQSMVDFCKSNKEEDALKIIKIGHDKDMRTCKVSSHTYKQNFKLVQDSVSGTESWVLKGDPEGPCGIVRLDRFELEKLENPSMKFWKYISRKIITNPNGELVPGLLCKDLDERVYVFDWRSKEHALECDYIDFSLQ